MQCKRFCSGRFVLIAGTIRTPYVVSYNLYDTAPTNWALVASFQKHSGVMQIISAVLKTLSK